MSMKSHSCKRCGQCCVQTRHKDLWKQANLTPRQFEILERVMDEKCRAFSICDGMQTCRIQLHFGYNAKPDICKQYICNKCKEVSNGN